MYLAYEFADLVQVHHSFQLRNLLALVEVEQGRQILEGKPLVDGQIDQMSQMQEHFVFLAVLCDLL